MVTSPSLQLTQLAPLVLVPAFILALLALWFVVSRIVPTTAKTRDQSRCASLGDFDAIKDPVGGHRNTTFTKRIRLEMPQKVQAAGSDCATTLAHNTGAGGRAITFGELHDDTIQSINGFQPSPTLPTSVKSSFATCLE